MTLGRGRHHDLRAGLRRCRATHSRAAAATNSCAPSTVRVGPRRRSARALRATAALRGQARPARPRARCGSTRLRASTASCTNSRRGSLARGLGVTRCNSRWRTNATSAPARPARRPSCASPLARPRASPHICSPCCASAWRASHCRRQSSRSRCRARKPRRSPAAISGYCRKTKPPRSRCRWSIGCARGWARMRSCAWRRTPSIGRNRQHGTSWSRPLGRGTP